MVKVIKGNEITEEDLNTIKSIMKKRCKEDYPLYNFVSDYANRKNYNSKNYTIYIGSDWYMVILKRFHTIHLIEMASLGDSTFKRSVEMLKVFKEIVGSYKNYVFKSVLRYDTTYRTLEYLRDKNIINILSSSCYSMYPDLNIRDDIMYKISRSKEIDPEYYKYIMYHVAFKFNNKEKKYVNR